MTIVHKFHLNISIFYLYLVPNLSLYRVERCSGFVHLRIHALTLITTLDKLANVCVHVPPKEATTHFLHRLVKPNLFLLDLAYLCELTFHSAMTTFQNTPFLVFSLHTILHGSHSFDTFLL